MEFLAAHFRSGSEVWGPSHWGLAEGIQTPLQMEPLPLEFAWHSKGKDVFVEALLFLQSAARCATGQTRAARLQGAAPESRGRERGAAPRAPCAGNCARFGCLALASCRRTALLPPRLWPQRRPDPGKRAEQPLAALAALHEVGLRAHSHRRHSSGVCVCSFFATIGT